MVVDGSYMPIAYSTHVALLLLLLCLLWSALFHHMQMFMHQNIWDWQLTDLSQKEEREEITYLAPE